MVDVSKLIRTAVTKGVISETNFLYKYSGVIAWPIRSLIIGTDKLRYNSKVSNQGFLGILGIILKRCLPLI